jgi:hypothetical protein
MTLKTFKTDLQAVQYMIQKSGESSWALEKSTGISRQTINRWIKSESLKLRRSVLSQFAKKMHYDIEYKQSGIAVSPHTKKQQSGDLNMKQQQMLIELQAEKIQRLEQQLKSTKKIHLTKPAYHFKMVSRYVAETDEWLETDIFGDFSMTGYTYDEMVPLMNEENDKNSWIDRYHPDSKIRLDKHTLKNIKTDYHYLKWDHMMWRAKNGKYECYNIDLLYIRAEEKVTSMFYWVNGDTE